MTPQPAYEVVQPLPADDVRVERYHDSATVALPFWVVGAATTSWLVARNFRDDLEPVSPELSALSWGAAVGLSFGGAGALTYGSTQAARLRDQPAVAGQVGFGMLSAASLLLLADLGLLVVAPEAARDGGTAETIAVGAVTLGVLSGLPGTWQWVRNSRRRQR